MLKEFICAFFVLFVVVFICFLLAAAGFYLDGSACVKRWEKRGYEAEFTFPEGCMYKDNEGRWH